MTRYFLLLVLLALPEIAGASAPGRVESAHLDRLRSLANGRIEAESASFDTAIGRIGSFGFGELGCDADGFAYRPIIHSKAVLKVNVPHGSRRLDLVVRATQGVRELKVVVDNAVWARTELQKGWQRISLPLGASNEGPLVVELALNQPGERFEDAEQFPPATLGLFHALITKLTKHEEVSVAPQAESLTSSQLGWLEAGEVIEIPIPVQKEQALESPGLRVRAGSSDLAVKVLLMSAQGAREEVAHMAAGLALPWNLDLSRRGEMVPYWLRFEVEGSAGSLALVSPKLTTPGQWPEARTSNVGDRPVVLVALRNTGYGDAEGSRVPMPGTPLQAVHTTSTLEHEALQSLIGGRYPIGRTKRDGKNKQRTPSLVRMARKNGRYATLVSAAFPRLEEAVGVADFDHVRLSGPSTFGQAAEQVLKEAESLLIELRNKKTFTTVLLRDAANPLSPQRDTWKRFYRGGKPPWKPADTRKTLMAIKKKGRALTKNESSFLDALRKGAVQQALRAVRDFSIRLQNRRMNPIVVVVGLGATDWTPRPNAMTIENTRIPVWFEGLPLPAAAIDTTADLTDVATTLAGILGGGKSLMQGSDLRSVLPHTWSESAFVRDPFGDKLAVSKDVSLLVRSDRRPLRQSHRARQKDGTYRWEEAPENESQALLRESLRRQISAHDGAGASWHPSVHGATVRLGGEARRQKSCKRRAR